MKWSKELHDLNLMDTIRHIKRGSTYQVIAKVIAGSDFEDNSEAFLFLEPGVDVTVMSRNAPENNGQAIPVKIQKSVYSLSVKQIIWIAYKSLDGEKQGDTYARPAEEFDHQRFEKLNA